MCPSNYFVGTHRSANANLFPIYLEHQKPWLRACVQTESNAFERGASVVAVL